MNTTNLFISGVITLASLGGVEAQSSGKVDDFTYEQKKEILSLLTQIPNTGFFVKGREKVSDEYEATVIKKSDTGRVRITNNWVENNTEQKTVHLELGYKDICTGINYFFNLTIKEWYTTEPKIPLESPSDKIFRLASNILSQNPGNVGVSLKRQSNLSNDTLHSKINENGELVTIEEDPLYIFLRALKAIVYK